jgi:hypothetical protein
LAGHNVFDYNIFLSSVPLPEAQLLLLLTLKPLDYATVGQQKYA